MGLRRGKSTTAEGPPGSSPPLEEAPARAWPTHLALLLVQFAFASQAVEAKIAMMPRAAGGEEIFPAALAMLRMAGAALFFQVVHHARAPQRFRIARQDHARLAGLAVLGVVLNQAFFLFGLRWASPVSASLLGATIPVFTAALAVLLRKEPFSVRTAVGLVLAVIGVLSLTGFGRVATRADFGVVLVALNSLSYSAYVVLSRDLVLRLGALRMIAWIFTYGALIFAPFGLPIAGAELAHVTARGWAYVGYIVAVPTIGAYLINAWALGRSRATVVTIYIVLQPLIAGLLAHVQLGQAIAPRALLAGVLIVAGLTVVASRFNAGSAPVVPPPTR